MDEDRRDNERRGRRSRRVSAEGDSGSSSPQPSKGKGGKGPPSIMERAVKAKPSEPVKRRPASALYMMVCEDGDEIDEEPDISVVPQRSTGIGGVKRRWNPRLSVEVTVCRTVVRSFPGGRDARDESICLRCRRGLVVEELDAHARS